MKNKQLLGGIFCLLLAGCASDAIKPVEKGMVLIPAGKFTMGTNKKDDPSMWRDGQALNPYGFLDRLYVDEHPMRKLTLPAYLIDQYEVTNKQYREFAATTRRKIPFAWARNGYNLSYEFLSYLPIEDLRKVALDKFRLDMDTTKMSHEELLAELDKIQLVRDRYPVTAVTWFDANAYCNWAGKRLPTEAEWEKAARGPKGNEYPWGNEWDPEKIHTMSEDDEMPYSAVGSFPGDKSVYGVYDMAANVTEWVADWYDAYPGAPASDNKFFGIKQRVVRGGMTSSGHYDSVSVVFRSAKRTHLLPNTALIDVGFRCAKDIK